jgi:hypothetical protein
MALGFRVLVLKNLTVIRAQRFLKSKGLKGIGSFKSGSNSHPAKCVSRRISGLT